VKKTILPYEAWLIMPSTQQIRILLIEKGLTTNALAKLLDTGPYNVSKMIHGQQPFYGLRGRLAKILGVPVEDIFPEEGDDRPRRGRPPAEPASLSVAAKRRA